MSLPRPSPRLDDLNRAFWTGGATGHLYIQHCKDCGQFTHPPLPVCRHCRSEEIAPKAVSGRGHIESFTINYQAWAPGMDVPVVIARIALDSVPEVYLTSNIVDCPIETIAALDQVEVTFEKQNEIFFPLFRKIS